jgi:hypothetical protein
VDLPPAAPWNGGIDGAGGLTSADARLRPAIGADACLEKPVEPERFRAIVARLSEDASANRGEPRTR